MSSPSASSSPQSAGGRLPPLGASALRSAVLASAASQTSYDRRTQDLLDKVTDVLSFGPSGLRSNNGGSGNKSGGGSSGGGSNMPTQTTISVVDGRRKQVTALKMDPPSAFDDLREPPRAVKQQILAQIAKKNRKNRKQSSLTSGGGKNDNSFQQLQQQQTQDNDDEDDDEDDDDDYEKKRDRERRQMQQEEGDEEATAESAVFLDSKKAAAAAAKPIPYYLRKGNRNSSTGTNATNQTETMMKSREIVIALGSERMDSKEMQKVIEHEYAVRMCEQLGISPSASNIAKIHKKLPLSECSVTQVMHPGLARGERRNCISIVPKFVKEQEERKLAALRGERNSLWDRTSLKKKEDLDETELMALLRAEEISRQKRQASATIQAHLQHMPGGSTMAGVTSSNNKDGNQDDGNNNKDSKNNNNGAGSGASPLADPKFSSAVNVAGSPSSNNKMNAFEEIKNRFVFPFNEPVHNNKRMEGAFERATRRASSNSPTSSMHHHQNKHSSSNNSKKVPLGRRSSQQKNLRDDNNDNNNNHGLEEYNNNNEQQKQDEVDFTNNSNDSNKPGYGQDRTEARLSMQDKLIQQKLIERELERRRKQREEEQRQKEQTGSFYQSGGFSNDNRRNSSSKAEAESFSRPRQANNKKEDPNLQRLLSETDVVRLSQAQLERLYEKQQHQLNNDDATEDDRWRHQTKKATNIAQNDDDDNEEIRSDEADIYETAFPNDEQQVNSNNKSKSNNNNNSNGKKGVNFSSNNKNKNNNTNNENENERGIDTHEEIETIDVSAMYQQHLVPPHVVTECVGIPSVPARIDLDEIRRQFLRNVPINDVFGQDIGQMLKTAILSEALLKAQEATIEFFTDVCFLGPVKRSELLRTNGKWLSKHVSSTSIDLQFAKMYECCTKLLRDRGGTASVSRVVTRSAVLFLMLRVTVRSYFVRRSPGLTSFDAGNMLISDIDGIFCASIDPGCLYARVPQLESMPQALRVLHAKRANRTGRRHALNPKAVSAKLQFVLGDDSKVLRRFQSLGTRSFEPVVLQDHGSGTTRNYLSSSSQQSKRSNSIKKDTTATHPHGHAFVEENDEDEDSELEEQADLLSHFLEKKARQQQSGTYMSSYDAEGGLNFDDDSDDDNNKNNDSGNNKNGRRTSPHSSRSARHHDSGNRPPIEQTQKHITRGLCYLKRILSPNVKTLLLDLKV